MNVFAINRDITALHHKFRGKCKALAEYLVFGYETNLTQTQFKLFEGFRLPERQAYLLGKGVSKSGPWHSAHNYGLAADFVPWVNDGDAAILKLTVGWSWDDRHDYDFLKQAAELHDLDVPISWDKVHVQSRIWPRVHKAITS